MSGSDAGSRSVGSLGTGAPVLAFDVGGTDIKSALIDGTGAVRGLQRSPTPRQSSTPAEAVTERIATLARELRHRFPDVTPRKVGIAAPGLIDEATGIGIYSSNLGWRDAPVRTLAERSLALPVALTHDVRAAALVEHRRGAARGLDDVVVIVIGTGISASVILHGQAHLAGGYAGEIGHSCVDPRGEVCVCGARGCLEMIASAGAIARRFAARSGSSVSGAREVVDRMLAGDPIAADVWQEAIEALALSIAQLVAAIAPEAVVLGGGLAQSGDALLLPLRERLDDLLSYHRRPRLLLSEVGENAGLLGAALLARDLADPAGPSSVSVA